MTKIINLILTIMVISVIDGIFIINDMKTLYTITSIILFICALLLIWQSVRMLHE